MGKNARELYLQNLRLGGGGFNSAPSTGGPPRLNKPPTASLNKFLKGVMNETSLGHTVPAREASPYAASVRSSTSSAASPRRAKKPSTPSGEDPAGSQDQILELKKEILAHQTERSLLKSKLNQLEKQCTRKDQQIDALLANREGTGPSSTSPLDGEGLGINTGLLPASSTSFSATQAQVFSSGAESRLTISLKQQVKELQGQIQEREAAMAELRSSLKSTSIEELTIEANTYFQEILRLRKIMEEGGDRGLGGSSGYITPAAIALQQAKEQARIFEKENAELKADLEQALQAAYKLKEELGSPVDETLAKNKYEAMSRKDLVKSCVEMESTMKVIHLENERLVKQNEGLLGMQAKLKDSEAAILKQKIDDLERMNENLQKLNIEVSKNEGMHSKLKDSESASFRQKIVDLERSNEHLQRLNLELTRREEVSAQQNTASSRRSPEKAPTVAPSQKGGASKSRVKDSEAEESETGMDDNTKSVQKVGSTSKREPAKGEKGALPASLEASLRNAPKLVDETNDLNLKSQTAINLQNQHKKKQEQKRETFVKKNKEDIDAAVSVIQAALRGHLARKKISTQLEQQDWVRVDIDGRTTKTSGIARQETSSSSPALALRVDASPPPSSPPVPTKRAQPRQTDEGIFAAPPPVKSLSIKSSAFSKAPEPTTTASPSLDRKKKPAEEAKPPIKTLSMKSSTLAKPAEPVKPERKKTLLETDTEDERESDRNSSKAKAIAQQSAKAVAPKPALPNSKSSPPKAPLSRSKSPDKKKGADSDSSVEYVDEEEDLVVGDD